MAEAKNRVVDVLVIGDGLAGCTAALAAQKARARAKIAGKNVTTYVQSGLREYSLVPFLKLDIPLTF
jgi:aspartate oxidase